MKLYKLTDKNDQTHNITQWGENVTHEGTGKGELCGPGWIHAYTDPLLAMFLNPIHCDFNETMHLWMGEGEVSKTDHGLKVGCKKFTTIKRMRKPKVTLTQKIAFGILCALEVCEEANFVEWANNWLNGTDRSHAATNAAAHAADAADAAADAAAHADAHASASAAHAAADAAASAAYAAATHAAQPARAATHAARAAAHAAHAARAADAEIDLIALAKKAMTYA